MISSEQLAAKILNIIAIKKQIQENIRLGVCDYLEIKRLYERRDFKDEFIHIFNRFYHLRGCIRDGEPWNLIKDGKKDQNGKIVSIKDGKVISVENAIERLVDPNRKKVNTVFASKALHTIDNDLPIYDSLAGRFWGIRIPWNRDFQLHIQNAAECYKSLCQAYDREMKQLKELANVFKEIFPESHASISEVKQIDFMIWGYERIQSMNRKAKKGKKTK